jgi:putative transcriptional regulator
MLQNNYNTDWLGMSDQAIVRELGFFLKETRLKKNLTQMALAEKAGIHRVTLNEFELGKRGSLKSFIQVLRALNELELLEVFKVKTVISPLVMAKMEAKKRKRASRTLLMKIKPTNEKTKTKMKKGNKKKKR